MSKRKNEANGLFIIPDETMTLRILEVPSFRPSGGVVYMNFKRLKGYHTRRSPDGRIVKEPCSNPYRSKGGYCEHCARSGDDKPNIAREYDVEVQVFGSKNGRESDGEVYPDLEYDINYAYPFSLQMSLSRVIQRKFEEMQKLYGISPADFPKIKWTVRKLHHSPYHEVIDAEFDRNTPFPSVSEWFEDEMASVPFTPVGADNADVYNSNMPPRVSSGMGLKNYTKLERDFLETTAEEIRDILKGGTEVTPADVRDYMLDNYPIVGSSLEEKTAKVEWALYNMFDHDWNLRVDFSLVDDDEE